MRGNVSIRNAVLFAKGRPKHLPSSFQFNGIVFQDLDGSVWSLVLDIFIRRTYNPPGWEIGKEDVVVDIGAHCGVFSAYATTRTRNEIVVYEPHPINYSQLKKLISINGFTNIHAYERAIGAQSKKVDLYISESSTRHSIQAIDKLTLDSLQDTVEVAMISLGAALIRVDHIHYMKIDCEGSEYDIIIHADDSVFEKTDKLAIEYHMYEGARQLDEMLRQLRRFYRVIDIKHHGNLPLGLLFARK